MTKPTAVQPPPPPAVSSSSSAKRGPSTIAKPSGALAIETGKRQVAQRILLYGAGGIGKTTLAAQLPSPLFIDLEGGTNQMDAARVTATDWNDLRAIIAQITASPPDGYKSIVLDSATMGETLAGAFILRAHGSSDMRSVDEIPYGRGAGLTGSEMLLLVSDLDRIAAAGMNVCVIAHELSATVPSPVSEDFLRAEPALYAGDKRGRNAVRGRFVQWADSVVWLSIDRFIKDGKAQGSGSRTAYTAEAPSYIAKSRTNESSFPIDTANGAAFWAALSVS